MIFDPITINHTQIKNRLVVSSMVVNYCDTEGRSTEKFMAYHEHKARGGFGLIITEDFAVQKAGRSFLTIGGLWEDAQIASHKQLTDRVHAYGAKMFVQLFHAGRQTTSEIAGAPIVAPTALRDPTMPEIPRELTVDEIHTLVSSFGDAAVRARKAGFDGVEIHAGHGYLVNQFLSPFSNRRCDEYGGTIQNRSRILVEIIHDIRRKCGNDYPIQVRMSVNEYVPGGLGVEESKVIARIAEQAGADSLHCSQGVYATTPVILPPSCIDHGAYIDNAYEIKKAVSIPVIGVGRINDPEIAETILRSGKADMCTMARASIADPEMPNKALAGEQDDILHCIGCLQGCIGENNRGRFVRCMVNPMTGMEDVYKLEPTETPKKILVVGGGVAGCEAAIVAAQRGHQVTILEKSDRLGGQFIVASLPIGKGEFNSFIVWQKHMIRKLGIQVVYHTEATRAIIDSYKPDAVHVANGSNPAMPPIPGLRENGTIAHKYLLGEKNFGQNVVVIGGGLVGAETADHMAVHGAAHVTIVEMMPDIMVDGEPGPTFYVKQRFREHGVTVHTNAKVVAVEPTAVVYEKDGKQHRIEDVDTIVTAIGAVPDRSVADALAGSPYEVKIIGDASTAKNGFQNIQEGYEAGLYI